MKKQLLFVAFAMCSLIGIGQVPSYVPTDGLVGYWPFNGNANDESGNGNNGTVNGALLTDDRNGVENSAYSFDGIDNDISLATPEFTNQISMSFWAFDNGGYPTTNSANPRYISAEYCNGGFGLMHNHLDSPSGLIFFRNRGQSSEAMFSSVNTSEGVWQHIVVTYDGMDCLFYLNSELVATISNSGALVLGSTLYFGKSGCQFGSINDAFNGTLDDIGLWHRSLTTQEIQGLFNGCDILPTTIAGNQSPFTLTSFDYSCSNNVGSTYEWTVNNGVITAGQGTSNVTVLWGAEGVGTLSVVETNSEGCSGAPASIEVNVVCLTTATTISGPLGPNALTSTTYTCDGDAGSTYVWTISNGVITSGQGTNAVTVLWAGTGLGNITVQETTNANCEGNIISMDVVVIPTGVEELETAITAIYPNPAKDIITIDFNGGISGIGKSIRIMNPLGQVFYSSAISKQFMTVDVSAWSSGTYLLSVLSENETLVQSKTIIIE